MRTAALPLLIGVLASTRQVEAQHTNISLGGASANGCAVCHTSHPGRTSTHTLILDRNLSGGGAWLRHQAVGVTASSLSCLRCHTDASVRQQQPEFTRHAAVAPERTFLGFDLGDDHVMGVYDPLMGAYSHGARDPSDPRGAEGAPAILGDTAIVIECTTCHDPHDRVSATPDAGRQRLVCGSCHDLSTYVPRHHAGQACSDCHAVHGSLQAGLLVGRGPEETCGRCHGGLSVGPTDVRGGFLAAATGPRMPLSGDHEMSADCTRCHQAHER